MEKKCTVTNRRPLIPFPRPKTTSQLFFVFFFSLSISREAGPLLLLHQHREIDLIFLPSYPSLSSAPFSLFTPPIPHRRTTWLQHTNKKKNIVNGLWIHVHPSSVLALDETRPPEDLSIEGEKKQNRRLMMIKPQNELTTLN